MRIDERTVAVHAGQGAYPATPPFHPSEAYPEYEGPLAAETNAAYAGVRNCLRLAGLDVDRFGTPHWNPLADLIRPGETVLVKPNLVRAQHPRFSDGWRYNLTNGSVIRAACDYIWKAVGPGGRVLVGDAPSFDTRIEDAITATGLDQIAAWYQRLHLDFEVLDLRLTRAVSRDEVVIAREQAGGDPFGYVAFDLGTASEMEGHPGSGRYYGADYNTAVTNRHHRPGRHQYHLAGSAFHADVLFSIPKLKTHKKAGITAGLKNVIGICGDKNWLAHHTEAGWFAAGDEHPAPNWSHKLVRRGAQHLRSVSLRFPRLGAWIYRRLRNTAHAVIGDSEESIRSGNWWGNDTVWRTILDVQKIVAYGTAGGWLRPPAARNRRRVCVLVDGIIAGEGRGPCNPDPVAAGLVLFGLHPASVDASCAVLMGFDPDRIPLVRGAFQCRGYALTEWSWRQVRVVSNCSAWNAALPEVPYNATFHFEPHFGWKGRIERGAASAARRAS